MEVDWDLNAVVRSCTASTSTSTANAVGGAPPPLSTTTTTDASLKDWNDFSFTTTFQDPFFPITETSSADSELHEAYKPFYPNPKQQQGNAPLNLKPVVSPRSLPISPLSVINGLPDLSGEQQKLMNQTQSMVFEQRQDHLPPSVSDGPKAPRSKKKKNKLRKVCHVPMEQVKSDMWAWRKYGQKPIKGTPYPRGYYKCSTSKACPARKFVERSRSDQTMFIVTYVSEHNHAKPPRRSSAAGTTQSASAAAASAAAASSVADVPSPVTSNLEKLDAQSLNLDLIEFEFEDEDDDLFNTADVPIEDDFFKGLEDFPGQELGSDDFFEGLEEFPGQEFGPEDFFEGLEDLPGQEFGMDDFFKDL